MNEEKKMNPDDEIWEYDEPHQSGGNCCISMTKKQAIAWMRKYIEPNYDHPISDKEIFEEWITVNWANPTGRYEENK